MLSCDRNVLAGQLSGVLGQNLILERTVISEAVMWYAGGTGFCLGILASRKEGNLRLCGKNSFQWIWNVRDFFAQLTDSFYENRAASRIVISQFLTNVLCHKLYLTTDQSADLRTSDCYYPFCLHIFSMGSLGFASVSFQSPLWWIHLFNLLI